MHSGLPLPLLLSPREPLAPALLPAAAASPCRTGRPASSSARHDSGWHGAPPDPRRPRAPRRPRPRRPRSRPPDPRTRRQIGWKTTQQTHAYGQARRGQDTGCFLENFCAVVLPYLRPFPEPCSVVVLDNSRCAPGRGGRAAVGGGVGLEAHRSWGGWLANGAGAADSTRLGLGAICVRSIAIGFVDNRRRLPEQQRIIIGGEGSPQASGAVECRVRVTLLIWGRAP
eukprot:COSAG04_NODE_8_length_44311_cov_99.067531_25_plen_227_part_00